jgi:hypothetical protein
VIIMSGMLFVSQYYNNITNMSILRNLEVISDKQSIQSL